MYINNNSMASNVANTLTSHYSDLKTSTERLSTGLRVNSAADDAAGLAIRELMRTDIKALQQGVRNANDAISLIQTADGALGIIDEKLTRMKELAEQASTGTYDSTQRLMIESEYQAMASEITRIANATDFNGIHLLDGNLSGDSHDGAKMTSTGKMKVHFGTANDSAEDYYYIQIGTSTASALGVGNETDSGRDGATISTQEAAQKAARCITSAVVPGQDPGAPGRFAGLGWRHLSPTSPPRLKTCRRLNPAFPMWTWLGEARSLSATRSSPSRLWPCSRRPTACPRWPCSLSRVNAG